MDVAWYVVAKEPREGDWHVNVFGPFIGETDARAFAMDLADDNGWQSVEPHLMTSGKAAELATDEVLWPYSEDQSGEAE